MEADVIILNRDGSTDKSVCSLGKNDVGVTFLHVKNLPTLAIVIILYHCIRYKAKFHSLPLVCVCTMYHLLFKFAVEHQW